MKGVSKLSPGHALVVEQGRISREWTYYDLPYDGKRLVGDEKAIIGELQSNLKMAVSH